jgi:hypothetical protein
MAKTVRALITFGAGREDGRPDNSLPGGGHIDNGLPGGGGSIDNSLPGDQPGIDNGLPGGRPDHPWFGGRPDRPDNALPGHGRPDNSLPIAPARPAHPIELPPLFLDPGFGVGRPPVDPGYGGGRPRPDRPDQGLPGAGARPDQGLPGGKPERPDQGLPGGRPERPDQGLPGGRPERPDQGLPLPPGHPDNSLPPGLGNGNFPIFIPPGSVGPGVPTLPIYLPTYLPPGSCLVIPVTGAHAPAPKEDAPAGMVPAVIWYGPGTVPTVAYVQQPAAPAEPK